MLRLATTASTPCARIKDRARQLVQQPDGATAIEYGLIAAGIAVAIIAAVFAIGTQLSTTFGHISTSLSR